MGVSTLSNRQTDVTSAPAEDVLVGKWLYTPRSRALILDKSARLWANGQPKRYVPSLSNPSGKRTRSPMQETNLTSNLVPNRVEDAYPVSTICICKAPALRPLRCKDVAALLSDELGFHFPSGTEHIGMCLVNFGGKCDWPKLLPSCHCGVDAKATYLLLALASINQKLPS